MGDKLELATSHYLSLISMKNILFPIKRFNNREIFLPDHVLINITLLFLAIKFKQVFYNPKHNFLIEVC